MSEITNSAINYHVYNLHEGDTLMNQVAKVICILLPRGLIVGGFSEQGDLLMIRYGDYNQTLPAWILDFYEHRFLDEPLLSNPGTVVSSFIAGHKNLVIPKDLFDKTEALNWLKHIYFIEVNEIVNSYQFPEEDAFYLYAYPATVKSLINRYFVNSKILPFASCQFFKPYKSEVSLECALTPEYAFATLYKNRLLQWHQAFPYENGEDIAYHIKQLCRQREINPEDISVQTKVAYRGLNPVLNSLSQYFPDFRNAEENGQRKNTEWAATINLLQQLYACAL